MCRSALRFILRESILMEGLAYSIVINVELIIPCPSSSRATELLTEPISVVSFHSVYNLIFDISMAISYREAQPVLILFSVNDQCMSIFVFIFCVLRHNF